MTKTKKIQVKPIKAWAIFKKTELAFDAAAYAIYPTRKLARDLYGEGETVRAVLITPLK